MFLNNTFFNHWHVYRQLIEGYKAEVNDFKPQLVQEVKDNNDIWKVTDKTTLYHSTRWGNDECVRRITKGTVTRNKLFVGSEFWPKSWNERKQSNLVKIHRIIWAVRAHQICQQNYFNWLNKLLVSTIPAPLAISIVQDTYYNTQ